MVMIAKRFLIDCVRLLWLMLLALLVVAPPSALAAAAEPEPAFVVRNASTVLIDKVYHLNA
jgi:hypothetical protein